MKVLILLVSLIIPTLAHAFTLQGVKGVEILAVDGQKVKNNFFNSSPLMLTEGKYQVVVRYNKNFKDKDTVTSKPYLFDINVVDDTTIEVRSFSNQQQAERAVKQGLTWIVKGEKQMQKEVTGTVLAGEPGFMPYKNIEKIVKTYNQKNRIDLLPAQEQAILATSLTNQTGNDLPQGKVQQLIHIYQSATKEQRKLFRIWLIEQDSN